MKMVYYLLVNYFFVMRYVHRFQTENDYSDERTNNYNEP